MLYNKEYFDAGLYRVGTRCDKWDVCRKNNQNDDLLPLWVADMDFPSPPAVQQALLLRAAHPTYGYTEPLDDDYQAYIDFWARRHHVELNRKQLMMMPCVITGAKVAIRAVSDPGDGVIICPPVYGNFFNAVRDSGRTIVECPMIRREDGSYDADLAAIEDALKDGARAMLFCSPHNPCGRLWTEDELSDLIGLCEKYNAAFISDEIHADFVLNGADFVSAMQFAGDHVIALTAASKTFNLAGLQQSMAFCGNEEILEKMRGIAKSDGIVCGNIFALEATRAAYNEGDAWLDGLLEYLAGNFKELRNWLKMELPDAVLTPLQATYLCWIDLNRWGFTSEQLSERCKMAGVCFTDGTFFGSIGDGFIRFNIACPRRYIKEGVLRLKKALQL